LKATRILNLYCFYLFFLYIYIYERERERVVTEKNPKLAGVPLKKPTA